MKIENATQIYEQLTKLFIMMVTNKDNDKYRRLG